MKFSVVDIICIVCGAVSILAMGIVAAWVGFMVGGSYPTYSEQMFIGIVAFIGDFSLLVWMGLMFSGFTRFAPFNRRNRGIK